MRSTGSCTNISNVHCSMGGTKLLKSFKVCAQTEVTLDNGYNELCECAYVAKVNQFCRCWKDVEGDNKF